MSRRMPFCSRAFGLLAIACATTATAAGADEAVRPPARPPVRVYTNADLERIHPFAGQTGGSSTPAAAAEEHPGSEREPAARGQGEAYWRSEAAAVRERVRVLEERAAGLRTRIAERERVTEPVVYGRRQRSSSTSSSGSGSIASLRASLAALERRMQKAEDDLADRARRSGALPGWLR